MKNIVMIGPNSDSKGGIGSVVNVYREGGLFQDWNITYLTTHSDGGIFRKITCLVISFMKFLGMLFLGKIGLVHVHSASRNSFWRKSIFLLLAILFKVTIVFHLHGGGFINFYEDESNAFAKKFIKYILDKSHCIIVLTKSWVVELSKITDNKNIVIVNNSVAGTTDQYQENSSKVLSLLFLGKLVPEKGLYELIEAFAQLKEKYADLQLYIGGNGDQKAYIEFAEKFDIESSVTFVGWVDGDRKNQLLSDCTLFVLPSYTEGLPVSILEAMAAGKPVVATQVGGIPDTITDGAEGLLVQSANVKQLYSALEELLSDPERRQAMGTAGIARVKSEFSAEKTFRQLSDIYKSLGANPPFSTGVLEHLSGIDNG